MTCRGTRRAAVAALAALAALVAGALPAHGAASPAPAGGSTRLGPAPADGSVPITLVLRFPGRDALAQYLAAQRTQPDPAPLTPTQIGQRYGLPADRLDLLTRQLAAAGLHVTERYDQRTVLDAAGTVGAVQRLFHTRLDEYRTPSGVTYRAPARPPRVPAALADAVEGVEGLDTRPVFTPALAARQQNGPRATFLTPQQLRHIYDASPLLNAGLDGQGQTIAIASLATLHGDEFADWAAHFKASTQPMRFVHVAPGAPRFGQRDWSAMESDEVSLDLEMSRAIAPKATILDYTTENDGEGLERIVNQVVQDRTATILSMSYGICEPDRGATVIDGYEDTFMAAAAAGVDMFAASGDSGPYDCNNSRQSNDQRISVNYPASSAYVTAVGGTTLTQTGGTLEEAGWQEPASIAGTGGGRSLYIPRPPWQTGPLVHESGTTRLVPDVAGPASPDFNLLIADFQSGHVVLETGGGTSAAAPFWAATTALVKEDVEQREQRFPNGHVNAMLYQLAANPSEYASAFHDVTSGSNQAFTAGAGWDFLTGLGTPNVANLAVAFDQLVHAG